MKYYTITIVATLAMSACKAPIISLETEEVYKTAKFGFTQANMVDGFLFTSGQVGWNASYKLTGEKSFKDQLEQTFINLENILDKGGTSFDKVVLLRFYVKDMNDSKRDAIGLIMKTYFPNKYKPNSTLIGVAELARKDLLVEIELIAKIK